MDKIIMEFSNIVAGWMNMHIFDYRTEENRQLRISYLQPFFDDLLMLCKFLISDITGIYEVYIDQEGFDASIKVYKYQLNKDATMSVEIRVQKFEDEKFFINEDTPDDFLYYHNVNIKKFINNIVTLIEKHKEEYNEGFVMSPSEELNEELLQEVKENYLNKFGKEGENNEKISNT